MSKITDFTNEKNVSVCTFKTSPFVLAPRAHEKRRRKRWGKTKEDKTRQDKREDSFSVWWCMAVFCWCSDFLVNSVCARVLSLPNSVKHDSSFISFSAPWQVNSFFNICELFILCSCSFQFFLNFFGYAVTVSKFFRII